MFQDKLKELVKHVRQKRLANSIRNGMLPHGSTQEEVLEALRATKPGGVMEVFGFLRMRIKRAATGLWEDYGLVSTKLVTTAFAAHIVDCMLDNTTYVIDTFTWHDMGDDNTAEANSHTALQNSRETRVNDTSPVENTAQVYQSIATITATAGYTVNEHGIFNNTTVGVMLDRNLVPNAPVVVASDQVEFTYELTVNAES